MTRGDQKEHGPVPVSDYCYKNQLVMFTVFQSINLLCILCTYSFLIPMRKTHAWACHITLNDLVIAWVSSSLFL